MSDDQIKYIITTIVERGKESAIEAREDKKNDFKQGRAEAYWEVLDIIKTRLDICGENPKEYGLDINLEETMW